MLKKLLLALGIALMPVAMSAHKAEAQTAAETNALFNELAVWGAELQKVAKQMDTLFLPVEAADATFNAYLSDEMSEEVALAQLAQHKVDLVAYGAALSEAVENLPEPPTSLEDLLPEMSTHLSSSMTQLNNAYGDMQMAMDAAIDVYVDSIKGDIDATDASALVTIDRGIATIQSVNTILQADKLVIPTPEHPQLSALDCALASNNAVMAVLEIERTRLLGGPGADYQAHYDDLLESLEDHRAAIKKGDTRAAAVVTQIKSEKLFASGEQEDMLARLEVAMGTYALGWSVEEKIIAEMQRLADGYADGTGFGADLIYDDVFDKFTSLEMERQNIFFERIAALSAN